MRAPRALLLLVVFWAAAPLRAVAQRVDLYDCVDDGQIGDACSDLTGGGLTDLRCPQYGYRSFWGRLAWPPLRYVGPITVEVEARATVGTRFPLYLEFFPLADRDPTLGYCDGPASLLALVEGGHDCGSTETFGPIDLERFDIGMNELYVVRAHFVGDSRGRYASPKFRCIRVQPVLTAAAPVDWGRVKLLYR